jgi:hypothetical protein
VLPFLQEEAHKASLKYQDAITLANMRQKQYVQLFVMPSASKAVLG